MKLNLTYYGNPILRKKTKPVKEITDEIRTLVHDMVDTMRENNGIGIAAPQVNRSESIFITEVPIKLPDSPEGEEQWQQGPLLVFINPKILSYSEEKWNRDEGCLSIPGLRGDVIRPVTIVVQAMDLDGNLFKEEFSWLDARAIMHENDHINGVLFIDRMNQKDRNAIENKLHEIKRKFRDA